MNLRVIIGQQSAIDVIATTFKQYNVSDVSMNPNFNKVTSQVFNGSPFPNDSYVSRADAVGSLTFELTLQTLIDLFPAMGYSDKGSTTETVSGLTISDEYILNASGFPDAFFTVILQNMQDDEERIILNAKFNTTNIAVVKDAYVNMTCDILGKSMSYSNTITHTTFTQVADWNSPLTCVVADFYMGSTKLSDLTQSVTLNINNNLENRFGLGSNEATRTVRNGFIESTLDIEFNSYDKTQFIAAWNALNAGTDLSALIQLQESYTAGSDAVAIMIHRAGVDSAEMGDLQGSGSLTETLTVYNDPTRSTPITFAFGTI